MVPSMCTLKLSEIRTQDSWVTVSEATLLQRTDPVCKAGEGEGEAAITMRTPYGIHGTQLHRRD